MKDTAKKRTTLKDIAKATGVSAVTVHKALYAKTGVSEKMRARVLDAASSMNYSVNAAASSLKRKALHIAVIFPSRSGSDNYFFRQMWKGIDQAERDLMDYSVRIIRFECGDDYDWKSEETILQEAVTRYDVDGVVLNSWDETKLNPVIDDLYEKRVPVVTVNSDAIGSKRIAHVSASNEGIGRLAAELLNLMAPTGRLLLVGGSRMVAAHRANREGFEKFMKERGSASSIGEVLDCRTEAQFEEAFASALKDNPDVCGVYAITARDTYRTCNVVEALGLSGKIRVVGSDIFEELLPHFENGTLQATIWKDPQAQVERAVLLLYRYLTGRSIEYDPIKMGIILKNNAKDYL